MALDLSNIPQIVKQKIEELEKAIDFSDIITKGGNGYVLIGTNKLLARKVVVKFYYWGGGIHAEPNMLSKLQSDNILKVYDAAPIDDNDAYFVTPYCDNGDIDDVLAQRVFGPVEAIDALLQISSGVSYLHGSGFLHRDLKPSNVFCEAGGHFVIGDFGSVVVANKDGYAETQSKHSLIYRPPEDFVDRRYYKEGDIYQLGILFYQLLGGNLPYHEAAWLTKQQNKKYAELEGFDQQLFARSIIEHRILKGRILSLETVRPWVPKHLLTIIRKCCATSRDARYASAAELIATLNNIRSRVPDWRMDDGLPTLVLKRRSYRVVAANGNVYIEKRAAGPWRRERSLAPATLAGAFRLVADVL